MSDELNRLINHIVQQTPQVKQAIFEAIKHEICVHPLEHDFGIGAQIILEAIRRSSDLTQRGVRGVIGETVFATLIAPNEPNWQPVPIIGEHPYDVLMNNGHREVRVQVKMQRRLKGEAWLRGGQYVVEVQRTRTGKDGDGNDTRPYRTDEFDVLAVCMQPSTGNWRDFLCVPVWALSTKPDCPTEIATMQAVPHFPAPGHRVWTTSLSVAIERYLAGPQPILGQQAGLLFGV